MASMKRLVALLLCIATGVVHAQSAADVIPRPPELQADVDFWIRVYSQITTNEGFLHDERDLSVVYETLRFAPNTQPKQRSEIVDEARKRYQAVFDRLLTDPPVAELTGEEKRVRELWSKAGHERLKSAREGIRFQLGQADRFRAGLVRAGTWEAHIAQTLANLGLPPEIAALPHVESSFNPAVYSKVGAAGLWQFMRSTGRRYMRIDSAVDERMDPFRSTEAAAQLLAYNYRLLGTWPLALTAYNHGAAGMRRAAKATGTTDFVRINRSYRSQSFGFASRNFYPSFLAALTIDQNPEKYFGPIERASELEFTEVAMPSYAPVKALERSLSIDRATLRELNPALLPTVWNGERLVPRGYRLRLPGNGRSLSSEELARLLPDTEQYVAQIESRSHRVKKGETLASVAQRYGISTQRLASLNGLRVDAGVRQGRRLRLPERMPALVSARAAAAAVASTAEPGRVYVVKRGDSLSAIAARSGVSEREVMRINGLRNPNYIFEGQRLRLSVDDDEAPAAVVAAAEPAATPAAVEPASPEPVDAPAAAVADTAAVRESREDEAAAIASARRASRAEPVSAREAEALGPALVTGGESVPSSVDAVDYSVASDGSIRVVAAETLGHYADWLGVSASRLRQINKLRGGQPVLLGNRLKLDLGKTTAAEFEQKRRDYHYALQANFFNVHRILGTEVYVVRRGDSMWRITQRYARVPAWLLQQYNPDLNLGELRPGAQIVVPKVEAVAEGSG
ncbi:MAG TPA: LysM peptidoglycan-binding domain-containing protein [Steroidobacteraceae bacterium]|nr:LysM peptidoglycan-binding domain-containing protein [Steroidobacteraceae bacterium]HNS28509.1 LysM peptidoglycan-binding domain-containing protein [Steroidobacteraceae bacterium]